LCFENNSRSSAANTTGIFGWAATNYCNLHQLLLTISNSKMKLLALIVLFAIGACSGGSKSAENTNDNTDSLVVQETQTNSDTLLSELTDTLPSDGTETVDTKPVSRTHWVVGKWRWVKTRCCGRAAKITTPDAQRLLLLEIQTGGNYSETDGGAVSKGKYTLSVMSEDDSRTTIAFDDNQPALLQGGGDTLILNYEYMDLEVKWFVRIADDH
jgi:hypothetical protein